MDRTLPAALKMPPLLLALNVVGGIGFVFFGLKGYWDYAGWWAIGMLLTTAGVGCMAAWMVGLWKR
jgi:hypothetical protein